MIKEFFINRGMDIAAWRTKYGEYPLTPTGEIAYKIFINRLKNGLPTNISDYMDILDGYDYILGVKGLESLYNLNHEKSPFILANHEKDLPLKGRSLIFPIGYHVKKATQKEIRWVYGTDFSLDQFGKDAYEKSLNFILVGGKNLRGFEKTQVKGVRELLKSTEIDVIGLYPEEDNGNKLLKGKRRASGIIANAAKKDVDIICSSIFMKDKTFELTFQKLDNAIILNLWNQISKYTPIDLKNEILQQIVDYARDCRPISLPSRFMIQFEYVHCPEQGCFSV